MHQSSVNQNFATTVALHQPDVRPSGLVRGSARPPGLAFGSPVKNAHGGLVVGECDTAINVVRCHASTHGKSERILRMILRLCLQGSGIGRKSASRPKSDRTYLVASRLRVRYTEGRDFSPYEQGPGQTDLTVVDGGLPSLMDSIRRCRTGG
jgi:hypothetical protein